MPAKKTVKKTIKKKSAGTGTLVIVESPTKAKTISKFIGKGFQVESSFGHIRDLPKSKLGIDVDKDFEPQYVIPMKSKKRVTELKKAAAAASSVILATDEDREGEAIAWHLAQALSIDESTAKRIAFHEITESAIKDALDNPRTIDMRLVDAQTARRVLDRLVGYKISPFLWKKVMSGLSAGRVQSAAVRLIVEREEEIRKFISEDYFTVSAELEGKKKKPFSASLNKIEGKNIGKPGIMSAEETDSAVADLKSASFSVVSIEEREVRRAPNPPFTTSTLQQECAKRFHFSAKQTMMFAQELYEKGFITYMRTDSVNLSKDSLVAAGAWITGNLGKEYAVDCPRVFKTKSKSAQEAHEAIRPTNPSLLMDSIPLEERHQKLYDIIWRRFISSQLPSAVFVAARAIIKAEGKKDYELSSGGSRLKFDGYLKIWPAKFEEKEAPDVEAKEALSLISVSREDHKTEPPPRYNEASLIKTLEENGIGRPSTYAPIISVIQARAYVKKDESRRFIPTEIGESVNKILVEHFPEIVDIAFTAKMENELDEVADGHLGWRDLIRRFYEPFAKHLAEKYESVEKEKTEEPTDEICDKCGKPMVIKRSRFGRFIACTGYPECKNTKKIAVEKIYIKDDKGEDMICPKCGEGKIILKRTRRGKGFFGCERYPACDFASWTKPGTEEKTEDKKEISE